MSIHLKFHNGLLKPLKVAHLVSTDPTIVGLNGDSRDLFELSERMHERSKEQHGWASTNLCRSHFKIIGRLITTQSRFKFKRSQHACRPGHHAAACISCTCWLLHCKLSDAGIHYASRIHICYCKFRPRIGGVMALFGAPWSASTDFLCSTRSTMDCIAKFVSACRS